MADTTLEFQTDFALTSSEGAATHPVGAWTEDRALISALDAGEETAYEALVLRFEQPVFGVVSRLLDDPADAADVVQEVFIKIFRNIGSFRGDSSLKTWVYRIAVNEARNHRRWFGRHRAKELSLEPSDTETVGYTQWLADPSPGPFEERLDHEVQALVEEALQKISSTYRMALVLREVEELSYEEIAGILEISLGTVKSRIMRGREALRKELSAMVALAPVKTVTRFAEQKGNL